VPGDDQTTPVDVLAERLKGFRELVLEKLANLEKALEKNSSDTRWTKHLMIGILVTTIGCFVSVTIKGCAG
jgi:t-SNARE complex subunit (syntaxin)